MLAVAVVRRTGHVCSASPPMQDQSVSTDESASIHLSTSLLLHRCSIDDRLVLAPASTDHRTHRITSNPRSSIAPPQLEAEVEPHRSLTRHQSTQIIDTVVDLEFLHLPGAFTSPHSPLVQTTTIHSYIDSSPKKSPPKKKQSSPPHFPRSFQALRQVKNYSGSADPSDHAPQSWLRDREPRQRIQRRQHVGRDRARIRAGFGLVLAPIRRGPSVRAGARRVTAPAPTPTFANRIIL